MPSWINRGYLVSNANLSGEPLGVIGTANNLSLGVNFFFIERLSNNYSPVPTGEAFIK